MRWGGWGSNPRPADYEKHGPAHRQHYLHGYHGAVPPMALIAQLARMARSTNRSTPHRGDHGMPATESYRRRGFDMPRLWQAGDMVDLDYPPFFVDRVEDAVSPGRAHAPSGALHRGCSRRRRQISASISASTRDGLDFGRRDRSARPGMPSPGTACATNAVTAASSRAAQPPRRQASRPAPPAPPGTGTPPAPDRPAPTAPTRTTPTDDHPQKRQPCPENERSRKS